VSPTNTLDIAYVNVRGLNSLAYQNILNWIQGSTYKIVVASESWFLNRNQYLSNSFYLGESSYSEPKFYGRRRDGGLVAFISPSIRESTSIFYKSEYILGIIHGSLKIGFVYFPPSLDNEVIKQELGSLGSVDYLLGDFNVRLGKVSGDSISNCRDRTNVLNDFNSLFHLQYYRNSNIECVSRTDHVFSSRSVSWNYLCDLPFQTDHGLITFNVESCVKSFASILSPRFDFKPLHHPIFKKEFAAVFDQSFGLNLALETSNALHSTCYSMILPSTSETQEIIDRTYESFSQTISLLLDHTLTTYDARLIKSSPDRLYSNALSEPPTSVSGSIRSFKRSQRMFSNNNPITSDNPNTSPIDDCASHYKRLFDSAEATPTVHRQNDLVFATRFESDLIRKAISTYPNHKSMGPDGFHILVFKALTNSNYFMESVTDLFQIFAATSLVPSDWSQCNLHLLVKDRSKPAIASNTRPIALSAILRRIFEKLLLKSWVSLDESWSKLNFGQAGFRRGYSTLSHLVLSDELSRHDNSFSIFLDIKAAFDTVSWSSLNEILISRGCPDGARNIILSLTCKPALLNLSVNQSERVAIKTKKGVFQGGGISAFVFALYIDPLAIALNGIVPTHKPAALLYADDIKLNPSSTQEAQELLDVCHTYAIKLKFDWNIKKCAVVARQFVSVFLANQEIPNSDTYKYLGAIHRYNRVDWGLTVTLATEKQSRFLESLQNSKWHPRLKLIIYRTFVRPINEYVLPLAYLWVLRHESSRLSTLDLMKKSYNSGVSFVFGRNQHINVMDFITGFGPFEFRMECLLGGLNRSFNRLKPENPLVLARSVYCVSSSTHYILHSCFNSTYLAEYLKVKKKQPLTWHTWKRQKLESIRIQKAKSSALISYYSPYHRLNDNSSPIFNLPSDLFRLICDWRFNKTLPYRTCSCGSQLTRTHLNCYLNGHSMFIEIDLSQSFSRSKANLQRAQVKSANYSVFDYLLNSNSYAAFLELLQCFQVLVDQ
jgi:hypothetical protein